MSEEKRLSLYKKLPISHRNEFWNSLMETMEDEVLLMMEEIEKKKTFLSYRESSLDNLLDLVSAFLILPRSTFENIRKLLNEAYGIPDEILEYYLRKELYKLPFNYKEKGTLQFYKTIFSTFGFSFDYQISIYRHLVGTNIIIRDIENLLEGVSSTIFEYGFEDDAGDILSDDYFSLGYVGIRPAVFKQQSKNNFSGYIAEPQIIDNGTFVEDLVNGDYRFSNELGIYVYDPENGTHVWDGLTFDSNLIFNTVTRSIITSTEHIGLEVELNDIMIKNYTPYLLPYEVLQYIYASAYFYKRQVEVPHVGAQLTVVLDKSGYWDTHSDEVITQNVVPLPDFSRDYVWQKGTGWKIEGSRAIFTEGPIIPPPASPEAFSLLQTAFVLPGMTLDDLLEGNYGVIPQGTQVRILIDVEELMLYTPSPTVGPLYVFTVDSSLNLKRVLFQIRTPGVYEEDFIWMDDELSVLSIGSLTPTKIRRIEAIPFDRFSVPSIRGRGAMKQGIYEDGLLSIDYLQFGMGAQRLPSRLDETYEFPTKLESPLAIVFPIDEGANSEKFSSTTYIGAIAQYIGQLVNGIPLGVFDLPPTGTSFFVTQLPPQLLPFNKGTLVLGIQDLTNPLDTPILVSDDGKGKLISAFPGLVGTINYSTGVIQLTFPEPYFAPKGIVLQQIYVDSPTFVTEVGVWGRTVAEPLNIQLLGYITFAPVELMSNAFHLNMGVILER